jgi:hypothetical protein
MSRSGVGGQFVEQGERLFLASGPAVFDKIQRRGDRFTLEAEEGVNVGVMISGGHTGEDSSSVILRFAQNDRTLQ